jgi:magnesium and cobalt exporter, CNNM family
MVSMTMILSIGGVFALVALNGLFVAAEFAIVRVRRTRLEELAGEGKSQAKEGIELVDEVSDYLTTTQVGITASSLGVGWLGENAFAGGLSRLAADHSPSGALIHVIAAALAFGLVTMVHVVVGEIVPKNMAISKADHFLLGLARPLRVFHRAIRPASRLFTLLASCIQRLLGHEHGVPPALSEEELKLVLGNSHEAGVLTEGEAMIILRAFEFADQCAEQIMVPADAVDFISLSRPFQENLAIAGKNMHARLPLCEDGIHSVRGIVTMKDVWLLRREDSNAAFERACRPATKVAYDLSQELILRSLQANKAQMAIVRDAADTRTLGIVTLEDVLESLVGDVREASIRSEPWPLVSSVH